jgi:hypothetical protein
MSLHINKFLEQVRAAESRGHRDLHMSLTEARDLHRDITRLLLKLETLTTQQPIQIDIQGGSFRNS